MAPIFCIMLGAGISLTSALQGGTMESNELIVKIEGEPKQTFLLESVLRYNI